MKKNLKLVGAVILGLTWTSALFAGNAIFNFDQDPGNDLALNGSIIIGTHNYTTAAGFSQLWCSGGADPSLNPATGTNGNPKTGGYLSICDGTNGGNNLVFVFPDIDNGLPIRGFQIDMDMRVGNGNGSLGRPADGFSVSFIRAGDIALVNATNGVVGGFAGGDSLSAAQSPLGSVDVENGTKTGVSVVFDSWQGNYLPDTPPAGTATPATDREGIAVRVDDHTLIQLDLVNNRNEADCINAQGISTKQTTLVNSPPNGLSVQTGTNALVLTRDGSGCPLTYGATDASGSFTNLFWAHLMVRLTNNPNPNLTVTWKGVQVVNTNLPVFAASVGRLVLAGRTGGNNQNVHVDNIVVSTTPTTNTFLAGIQGLLNGFILTVSDNGPAIVQRYDKILLDGSDVTAQTVKLYSAPYLTGTYQQATRFAANSFHTITASWVDNYNITNNGSLGFVVANYTYFPTNFALPFSAVDQTQRGFLVNSYQSFQNNPNQARWNEEQILDLHGNNVVGAGTAAKSGAYFVWDGALGFNNTLGRTPGAGMFQFGSPTADADLAVFGITQNYPATAGAAGQALNDIYDNCALELFSYVYFPTSGVYNMVMGSDDSFQVSVSQNPFDRMGNVVWYNNGSRLPNLLSAGGAPTIADIRTVIIDQPGVYPIRILWDNGGGAAGLEWYTCDNVFSTPFNGAFLVNDTNSFGTTAGTVIQTFRALNGTVDVGPYVKKAIPVRDSQSVVFYQPIVIDLGDGTGSKTVDPAPGTISLTVDGLAQTFSVNKVGDTTHIIQTGTPTWSTTIHTLALTFQDSRGTNYSYSWPFTVIGGATAGAAAVADYTNRNAVVTLPLTAKVDPGTISQPGFNVHSHQMLFRMSYPNSGSGAAEGITEEQFEGLHGINIATVTNNIWTGLLDFRDNSGNGTDVGGEWSYDNQMRNAFGFQSEVNDNLVGATPYNIDNTALEIGFWLVFPSAGTYILYEQGDDGFKVTMPLNNNLFNKQGIELGRRDVNSNGTSGGVNANGTYLPFNVPAAGAYPFRLLWNSGWGSAMLELSIYQPMPDGSIAKVAVNDPNTPGSIKAYAASSVPVGPYISHINPAPYSQNITYYQPIVVEITDGATITVDASKIDSLTMDGGALLFTATKPAGTVTHIISTPTAPWVLNRAHTNVLVFHDSAGTSYTNTWAFSVLNFSAFTTVARIPASNAVPVASLSQPGFRIQSYQTTTGQPSTVVWTEQQFEGFYGANIADQSATNGPGFFSWNAPIEFNNRPAGVANSGSGDWNVDNMFTLFGAQPQPNDGSGQYNNFSLKIGTYLNFTQAGDYIMVVNSDDGFRCTAPYGSPFNAVGTWLGEFNAGRGDAGAGVGPRGGASFFAFNIPTPGAYPFRLLYENGGGGGAVEWELYQYLPNGGVAQMLIGDTNTPGAIQAFQFSSAETPYVEYSSLFPPATLGNSRPVATLSGNSAAATATNPGPVQQDIWWGLVNGFGSSINTSLPVTLSLNGYVQPVTVAPSTSNNWLIVTRAATNATWWPSGQLGPLLLSFTDSTARQVTLNLGTIATPFWGTLTNPIPITRIDTNTLGIKVRTYAVDPLGSQTFDTRVHAAEQVLAGLWGPNTINGTNNVAGHPLVGGYYTYPTTNNTSTVVSNGVVNFDYAGPDGDFQPAGFPEVRWPGIPNNNTVGNKTDNFMAEILAVVEFPTNGNYMLGVSSDDGFRLTKGWTPPANNGAMVVNSPPAVAGPKATVTDTSFASTMLTVPITADLALAQGIGVGYGSTTNGEGCVIVNDLTGKIALIYRSAFCGYPQQVQNAFNAHALAVVFVQNPAANGFPQEPGVSPPVGIPAVEVSAAVGNALNAILATNGTVNVTLSGMDYVVNPTAAQSPLGQADIGKGAGDILFPVVVQQAGLYPLRLIWFQGGGGANCEFFSVTGGNRVLINDLTKTTGPGLGGTGLRAWFGFGGPEAKIVNNGNGTVTLTFTGFLQVKSNLGDVWADYPGSPASPLTIPASQVHQFFRSRF